MKIAFFSTFDNQLIREECEKYISNIENLSVWWSDSPFNETLFFNNNFDLYSFKPDFLVLHFEVEKLINNFLSDPFLLTSDERYQYCDQLKNRIRNILDEIYINLPYTNIVFENFILIKDSSLGILDPNIECGINELVLELNAFLYKEKTRNRCRFFINDLCSFVSNKGRETVFDFRNSLIFNFPFSEKIKTELTEHYFLQIEISQKPGIKCIVTDLDNTLWGGTAGQEDTADIHLGQSALGIAFIEFQKYLLSLYRRGIFLAVCSKNNKNDAIEIIANHPSMVLKENFFSSIKIDWEEKFSNLVKIAQELNLSPDSILFIDDEITECELIKKNLPEVEVIHLKGDPLNYIDQLSSFKLLQRNYLTEEDLTRSKTTESVIKFVETADKTVTKNLYLESLQMRAIVTINQKNEAIRIAQLLLKTTQFNLTNKKYTLPEVMELINSEHFRIYTLKLSDKFEDYGTIAVAVIKTNKHYWYIENFVISCRVIGRNIESALLSCIIEDASHNKIKLIKGYFLESKRNKPASQFFNLHNFNYKDQNLWELETSARVQFQHYVIIKRGINE